MTEGINTPVNGGLNTTKKPDDWFMYPWGIILIVLAGVAATGAAVFAGYSIKYGLPCKKRQIGGN